MERDEYHRIDVTAPLLVEHAWIVRPTAPTVEVALPDGRGLVLVRVGDVDDRLLDASTGASSAEHDGLRGLTTRAAVRQRNAHGTRLGLQLHPLAVSALLPDDLVVDRTAPLAAILDDDVIAEVKDMLTVGDDVRAALHLVRAVESRADAVGAQRGTRESAERASLARVLGEVEARRGLIQAAELARLQEVTVSDLFRWSVEYLGVPPSDYLAAVRFAGFVREAVGPGVVAPADVVAAVRWYAAGGHAPREVERFTGLSPVALDDVARRLSTWIPAA